MGLNLVASLWLEQDLDDHRKQLTSTTQIWTRMYQDLDGKV